MIFSITAINDTAKRNINTVINIRLFLKFEVFFWNLKFSNSGSDTVQKFRIWMRIRQQGKIKPGSATLTNLMHVENAGKCYDFFMKGFLNRLCEWLRGWRARPSSSSFLCGTRWTPQGSSWPSQNPAWQVFSTCPDPGTPATFWRFVYRNWFETLRPGLVKPLPIYFSSSLWNQLCFATLFTYS